MATITQLTALGGAVGCDYRVTSSDLIFVEFSGNLSSLSNAPASIVSAGTTILRGTFTFKFDTAEQGGDLVNHDLWWEQQTEIARQMTPIGNAQIAYIGMVDFESFSPFDLKNLTYSTTPINGSNDASNQLLNGTVFGVLTRSGNYVKVQVLNYGYDIEIRWVSYRFGPRYQVLGSGYSMPEDVVLTADGQVAYVTERTGTLLKVDLHNGDRRSATVVTSGMNAPHQIGLDETRNQAYVVEFANPGRLLRIDLGTGVQTALVTDLEGAIGLLLDRDFRIAYVSEQTGEGGRIRRIDLTTGQKDMVATGLTNPFFMQWADSNENAIYVPERDPANRLLLVNLATLPATVIPVAADLPFRPSSLAMVSPSRLLLCSDTIVSEIDLGLVNQDVLLLGIGFVPFDRIFDGKANTSGDAGYFFQVNNVPFGGQLPLMLNYENAYAQGARYYQVLVDGAVRLDSWADYRWNPTTTNFDLETISPNPIPGGSGTGYYPVRVPGEIWLNQRLGTLVASTDLSNDLHTITLRFVDAAGNPVVNSNTITILVNNEPCQAMLELPKVDSMSADPNCGFLRYTNDDSVLQMDYLAFHPKEFATYSFQLIKGINVALSVSGNVVLPGNYSQSPTVGTVRGACTVTGLAEYLYVAATITNGWGRQSQYDRSAAIAFALAP